MHILKHKPYHLLSLDSLCMIVAAIVIPKGGLNFVFNEQSILFPGSCLLPLFAVISLILWLLNLYTQRLRSVPGLSWIHVSETILISPPLLIPVWLQSVARNQHPQKVSLEKVTGVGDMYKYARVLLMIAGGLYVLQLISTITSSLLLNQSGSYSFGKKTHPCPSQLGWSKEVAIEGYTTPQLIQEMRTADAMLDLIDNRKGPRAFAYPCNNIVVEGKPYASALKQEGLIWCACDGGDSNSYIKDKGTLSIYRVPSWLVAEATTTDALIAFAEKANKSGIMAVYQFHGIVAEFFTVSKDAHLGFLNYLEANKERCEVLTFSDAIGRVDIR